MSYCPQFHITPNILKLIEDIAVCRQQIIAATVQVPWIPILQREARIRTTHSSTAIEGNPLTLEEVRILEEGRPLPMVRERSRREILNQLAGLRFVEKNQNKKNITHADLSRLHQLIASRVMDQGQPGYYRNFGVRVGAYFPPAAPEVPKLMDEYLEWWHQKAMEWSPVISSAILHYRFEEIHPFADGNGRMGRALALWELYRRGFDTHHIFSVDDVYWENRSHYYAELDVVRKVGGDLTGWIEYSAEAIHVTLKRVLERVQKLSVKQSGQKILLTPKQEKILHLLQSKGGMTPNEIWKELKMTKQGAMKILKPLLISGLILRIGTRKSGKYIVG